MLRASAFSHRWWSSQLPVLGFAKQLVAFRRAHPVFRRDRFLAGAEASELQWFRPSGTPMTTTDWSNPDARSLAIFLDGVDDPDRAADGRPLIDDDFPLLVNSWWQPLDFTIPEIGGRRWHRQIDTFEPGGTPTPDLGGGDHSTVGPRSIVVLGSSAA